MGLSPYPSSKFTDAPWFSSHSMTCTLPVTQDRCRAVKPSCARRRPAAPVPSRVHTPATQPGAGPRHASHAKQSLACKNRSERPHRASAGGSQVQATRAHVDVQVVSETPPTALARRRKHSRCRACRCLPLSSARHQVQPSSQRKQRHSGAGRSVHARQGARARVGAAMEMGSSSCSRSSLHCDTMLQYKTGNGALTHT